MNIKEATFQSDEVSYVYQKENILRLWIGRSRSRSSSLIALHSQSSLVPRLSCLISRLGSFSLLGARYLLDDDRPPLPLQPSLRPVF